MALKKMGGWLKKGYLVQTSPLADVSDKVGEKAGVVRVYRGERRSLEEQCGQMSNKVQKKVGLPQR